MPVRNSVSAWNSAPSPVSRCSVEAEQSVARNRRSASSLTAATSGVIGTAASSALDALLPDETERALPAHPERARAAPRRGAAAQTEANVGPRASCSATLRRDRRRREAARSCRARTRRARGGRIATRKSPKPRLAARPDRKRRAGSLRSTRQLAIASRRAARRREIRPEHEHDPGDADDHRPGAAQRRDERQRRAEPTQARWRGASDRSSRRFDAFDDRLSTSSARRPSISAAGDSTTRWRSAGSVKRLHVVRDHVVAAVQRRARAGGRRQHAPRRAGEAP